MATGTPCRTRHCVCGCYSPGSLVGDWLARQSSRVRGGLRRLLRRPERFPRDPRGGIALPAWVLDLDQSSGARYDEAR